MRERGANGEGIAGENLSASVRKRAEKFYALSPPLRHTRVPEGKCISAEIHRSGKRESS